LLLHSAIQAGHEVEYWLSQLSDPEQRVAVLIEAARNGQAVVRQRTALVLGTQDVPGVVPSLLKLALHDLDSSVRMTARRSLVQLTGQRASVVAQLQSETEHADCQVRRFAREIWVMLPLRDLPRSLLVPVVATKTMTKTRSWIASNAGWQLRFLLLLSIFGIMMLVILYLLAISIDRQKGFRYESVKTTATAAFVATVNPPTNTIRTTGNTYLEAQATWVITNTSDCSWLEVRLVPAAGGVVVMPRLLQDNRPVDRVDPGESVTVELVFDAFVESADQVWYLVVTDQHGDLALVTQPILRLAVDPWVIGVTPTPTLTPTLALVSP